MGRAAWAAAPPVGRSLLPALLLLLVSVAASEGATRDVSQTRGMLVVPQDFPLLQLPTQAHDQGRESSSSYSEANLLTSGAQTGVDGGNKDAAVDMLMIPTKIQSTVGTTCSYTVTIKTSCYSPKITRDAISLSFSDGYGNQVYAARLDDPSTGTFEQCSTDTFRIQGPCGAKTCSLYLRRSGVDGWAPDWVKVVSPNSGGGQAVTFYYNAAPLPADVWYGFNLCPSDSGGGARAVNEAARVASWVVMVTVVVLFP